MSWVCDCHTCFSRSRIIFFFLSCPQNPSLVHLKSWSLLTIPPALWRWGGFKWLGRGEFPFSELGGIRLWQCCFLWNKMQAFAMKNKLVYFKMINPFSCQNKDGSWIFIMKILWGFCMQASKKHVSSCYIITPRVFSLPSWSVLCLQQFINITLNYSHLRLQCLLL